MIPPLPSLLWCNLAQVILASIVGYFAGKFSYATTCADKLLYQVNRSPPSLWASSKS